MKVKELTITLPESDLNSDIVLTNFFRSKLAGKPCPNEKEMKKLVDQMIKLHFPYIPNDLVLDVIDFLSDRKMESDIVSFFSWGVSQIVGDNWKKLLKLAQNLPEKDNRIHEYVWKAAVKNVSQVI